MFNTSTANINILEKLQNSCLRIISQAQRRTPCNRLRGELHIPSLRNRREYLYLCELYKIYHSIIPTISQPPHSPPNNRYTLRSVTASYTYPTDEKNSRTTRFRLSWTSHVQFITKRNQNISDHHHIQKKIKKSSITNIMPAWSQNMSYYHIYLLLHNISRYTYLLQIIMFL